MAQASVELGSMDIQPCSKVYWVASDIPFVKVPVLKTARQRLVAYAVVDSANMQNQALQAVKECALASVGAAGGIGAITGNPGAATAAFKAAFIACSAGRAAGITIDNVTIETRAECMW